MASRKITSRTRAYLVVATLAVLFAVVGLVSGLFLHGRIDLTRDHQFTLSEATLATLNKLPDIVTIKAVMSKDLPTQFQQRRTELADILEEFEARSGGKIKVSFEDPGDDGLRRAAAEGLGIQEVTLRSQNLQDIEVKKGYFGLALQYGDKKEVFPVIGPPETFEYDLVVKIKRLTGNTRTIGVVEGMPESRMVLVLPGEGQPTTVGFEQNFRTLKGLMEEVFEVQQLDVSYAPIDTSIDMLVIAAPTRLEEIEKYNIDQFLMLGKPVIFITPGMNVNLVDALTGSPANNNYEDMLSSYGVGVAKNVILEPRSWEEIATGPKGTTRMPYPYWMRETYLTLNMENPITSTLQALSFPWTSSLLLNPVVQDSMRTEVLARTSAESWQEAGELFLGARDLLEFTPSDDPQSFPLVVLSRGRLKSFYRDFAPSEIPPDQAAARLRFSQGEARILVLPSSIFATDFYLSYTRSVENLHMLLNAMDLMVLDPGLINIRSRQVRVAPLDEGEVTSMKTLILFANLAIGPLLLLLLWIFRSVRRRKLEKQT